MKIFWWLAVSFTAAGLLSFLVYSHDCIERGGVMKRDFMEWSMTCSRGE